MAELWDILTRDFIYLSILTFVLLFVVYLVTMKIHVYRYTSKHSRQPIHYKMFRLYNKTLISNAPSKKEKEFYRATNKITWTFNALTIAAFLIYLYLVFMR